MCTGKKQKIEKADPVAAPPPVIQAPAAPVLNDATQKQEKDSGRAHRVRKGRSALTIPLNGTPGATGVNVPR